jgi:SAM-dependent methyltransferase
MTDTASEVSAPPVETRRDRFLARVRPEVRAGGFARDDGAVSFFSRINALLEPQMTVVDLGAGRGVSLLGPDTYARRLMTLQGKVKHVVGIDVDDAVAEHPRLDEWHVVPIGSPYPLPDASVDVVVANWVLEHVADPAGFVSEIGRVLRPGGWFCARTPNRWSYVGIAANLIPNRLHTAIMGRLWPERSEQDVFPTVYRMNTPGALRRWFPDGGWHNASYSANPTPKYHGNNAALFGLVGLYQTLMPSPLRTDMMVFMQKAGG